MLDPVRAPTAPLLAGSVLLALCIAASPVGAADPRTLETNRRWDVLDPTSRGFEQRGQLMQAAQALGSWRIHLSGVALDERVLMQVARATPNEWLEAGLRERLRRPVDVDDLLYFLDDVLAAGERGLRPRLVWVTPSRARKHGILLHTDDVFEGRPRRYGERGALNIDQPKPQRRDLPAARDGDPPGPEWTMRYQNPADERARLAALSGSTGSDSFERRLRHLIRQLRDQGAEVYVNSTTRSPERGYLMWGAFLLSRSESKQGLEKTVRRLDAANREWGLDVPITWHAGDWRQTREAAREMADTYEVVFATEKGARSSNHYGGRAVDLVALGLPRLVMLEAPAGARRSFDLSGLDEPLDLSLSPALIEWIEEHYAMRKLRSDYPHWDDAEPEPSGTLQAPASGTAQ